MTTYTNPMTAAEPGVPQLLTAKSLALRLGLTTKGVRALPIPRVKLGRRATRYHLQHVLEYLQRRTVAAEGSASQVSRKGEVKK